MLKPDELNILPKQVSDIYAKLEEFVIKQIAEQLKISGTMNQKTINQIKAIQDLGFDIKRIDRAIQKATKLSDDELDNIYADAIRRTQEFTDKITSKSDLIPPVPDRTFEIISSAIALERQTKEEFKNFTRSMGFAQDIGGKTVFKPIAKFYHDTLDFAQTQVQSGVIGYDESVKNAVDTMVKSGLRTVDYKTGYTSKIEVAARRAVLTGLSQYTAKETEMRMEDLDTDLVEVSAHQGARDKGTGFENHKKWQGKVYSFYGNNPKYPSLRKETGYGDIQGLKGANCRHDFFPFIEGVSERTYTDEQLANIDPPPFEYEGKTYTAYEATQKQRQLETAMRNEKLKMVGYDAAGLKPEFTASSVKLRRLRKYYNDFSDKAGLKTQAERFRVTGYDKAMAHKANKSYHEMLTSTNYYDKVRLGVQKLDISDGSQGKHIRGHNNYKEGKSYLLIDTKEAQELINQYAGTGEFKKNKNGTYSNKELVSCDRIIGVNVSSIDNTLKYTSDFYIHYAKNGTHIVPTIKEAKNN